MDGSWRHQSVARQTQLVHVSGTWFQQYCTVANSIACRRPRAVSGNPMVGLARLDSSEEHWSDTQSMDAVRLVALTGNALPSACTPIEPTSDSRRGQRARSVRYSPGWVFVHGWFLKEQVVPLGEGVNLFPTTNMERLLPPPV